MAYRRLSAPASSSRVASRSTLHHRRAGAPADADAGVLHAQLPAAHGADLSGGHFDVHAAALGGVEAVQDEVLSDAAHLDRIARNRQRPRLHGERQTPRGRHGLQGRAQLAEHLARVEAADVALLTSGLEPRECRQVIQQHGQGMRGAFDRAGRGDGRALPRQRSRRQPYGADVAAQIVRRLAPQVGALALEHPQLPERVLQVAQAAGGLGLLQLHLRGRALDHAVHEQLHQHLPRHAHHLRIELGVRQGELLDRARQAQLQVSPLAHGLAVMVAVQPAVASVIERPLASFVGSRGLLGRAARGQLLLEGVEDARNVIDELRARQGLRRADLGIGVHCLPPGAEQCATLLSEIGREPRQLAVFSLCHAPPGGARDHRAPAARSLRCRAECCTRNCPVL